MSEQLGRLRATLAALSLTAIDARLDAGGKTHLAVALAETAIRSGQAAYFMTAHDLITDLGRAYHEGPKAGWTGDCASTWLRRCSSLTRWAIYRPTNWERPFSFSWSAPL